MLINKTQDRFIKHSLFYLGVSRSKKEGRRKYRKILRTAAAKYPDDQDRRALSKYLLDRLETTNYIQRSEWIPNSDCSVYSHGQYNLSRHRTGNFWTWELKHKRSGRQRGFITSTPYFPKRQLIYILLTS